MRILSLALALAVTGLLAACEPQGSRRPNDITQSNLDTARRIVKTEPARRQTLVHECRANIRSRPKLQRTNFATIMKVKTEQVPATFCSRVIGAIDSGRLNAVDLNAASRGQISPKMLAVIQGN